MLMPADATFAGKLSDMLPQGTISVPEPRHLEDPRGRWMGQGTVLVRPKTVAEVSDIVRACSVARVGIVPWGGGTGLVGGQVMPEGVAPDMRLEPQAVADVIAECVAGTHDAHTGWTLAVVAAGITPFIQGWVDGHPGGGVVVMER